MNPNVLRRDRRSGVLLSLAFGLLVVLPLQAGANVWQSTFGQRWFYETASGGQILAGTWWEGSLNPGTTYTISFRVNQVQGTMGLFVGGQSVKKINRTGNFSFDFPVTSDKRRLVFIAVNGSAMGSVANISVVPHSSTSSGGSNDTSVGDSGGSSSMPKGHYLSFARERNLKNEMLNYVDNPRSAPSDWHMGIARDIHDALTLQAVKGFSVGADWGTLETANGVYNWSLLDGNMAVARRLGLKFIVNVQTRSFDGHNSLPRYFPSQYSIYTQGGGKTGYTAKLWDPWVYTKLIRLYRAIANRYGGDNAFGGIATSETALGNLKTGNYSYAAYREAMTQIATQTQSFIGKGKLFWYLNFLKGADSVDMRRDGRINILKQVPRNKLVIGAPDITPDVGGMPGSVNSYRIHARKTLGGLQQFCHAQHVDQGQGKNVKDNRYRIAFRDKVNTIRNRERQSWYNGPTAIFEYSSLNPSQGSPVQFHPGSVLGKQWHPNELFQFATRNFQCEYFFWHYRENVHNMNTQFWWEDIRPIIQNNQYFYN